MDNILILGFGITGKSAYQALKGKYNIFVQDDNFDQIIAKDSYYINKLGSISEIEDIDPLFVVKSPGINPNNDYVQACRSLGLDIISDLELAYRLYPDRDIIAITGTNGKTTTTSLTGQILKKAGYRTHVIGNIGKGILEAFAKGGEDDTYLIEVSSFQLEDTHTFRPMIGAFLNFSDDHLDWHGSTEEYFKAKSKIFSNMTKKDSLILNKDNEALGRIFSKADIFFSKGNSADYYINGKDICGPKGKILSVDDIKLPGSHNLENILTAVSISSEYGVGPAYIKESVEEFYGVDHRLEFIGEIRQIKYYNDSKATNVDSAIRAIESFDEDLIVIAGGYDKEVSFRGLMEASIESVKKYILMGQTARQIGSLCEDYNIAYEIVRDMEEAVKKAEESARPGDIVLLSPACASWDMYRSFEERGEDFKKRVEELRN